MKFPFSTRCNLPNQERSSLREQIIRIQFLSWSIALIWFRDHNDFNMIFVFFISREFTEYISSRGRTRQMKTLVELFRCLKQVAILRRPFDISSDEYWCSLLYNITTLLKDEKVCKFALAIVQVALCHLLFHCCEIGQFRKFIPDITITGLASDKRVTN